MEKTDARIKSTHIPVRHTTCVNDTFLLHGDPRLQRLAFVYRIRLVPMLRGNQPKLNRRGSQDCDTPSAIMRTLNVRRKSGNALFELVRKWFFVQEDIRISKLSVESILYRSYTPHGTVDI